MMEILQIILLMVEKLIYASGKNLNIRRKQYETKSNISNNNVDVFMYI